MAVDGLEATSFSGFLLAYDVIYVLGLGQKGVNVDDGPDGSSSNGRGVSSSGDVDPCFASIVYISIHLALKNNSTLTKLQMTLLHLVPCGAFFCVLLEIMILGLINPNSVERHPLGMYCHLTTSAAPKITAALTIMALAIFICIEGLIAFMLWRLWKSTGRLSPLRNSYDHISFDVALRVVIFGFCPMVAIGVSSLQYFPRTNIDTITSTIIQAVLPVVAGLIFGTQRDILRVWMFWRKNSEPTKAKSDLA
uniref:Uncharacterized protein n=1 Tax=Psilocybe cubensis TaxID=181762 RepID=A0A8H7Y2X3_PSICU